MKEKIICILVIITILTSSLSLILHVRALEPFSKNNQGGDPEYSVMNDHLALYVEYEMAQGVGTATLKTDDGYDLLYTSRDHDAWSSYFTIQIDGTNYANSPSPVDSTCMNYYVTQYPTVGTDKITTKWKIESIEIEQSIELSGKSAKWKLMAKNLGISDHQMKLRYLYDYQIKDQDGAPIYVDGQIYTKEVLFNNPSFNTWETWDQMPNPTLRGIATLQTHPYKIIFANWAWAFGYSFEYGAFDINRAFYTSGYIYSPYSDSCALIYWDLGNVASGETKEVVTYYGVGSPGVTEKQMLINELNTLNEVTDDTIEAQVDALAQLYTTIYLGTYSDPAWSLAKWGIGFAAGIYTGTELAAHAPFLYEIMVELKPLLEVHKWLKLFDILTNTLDGLDPSLGESTIRTRFHDNIMSSLWVGSSDSVYSYEISLDNELQALISALSPLPDYNGYEDMILEIHRIRDCMERAQTEESEILYIDLSKDDIIQSCVVGELSNYQTRVQQTLEWFKKESTINNVATWTIVGGCLVKLGGWAFGISSIGIGGVVTVETEAIGGSMIIGGYPVQKGSSMFQDLTKGKALSIVFAEASPIVVKNAESVGTVYLATLDLIEKWSERGEYIGQDLSINVNPSTYIVRPLDLGFISLFDVDIKSLATLTSNKNAKAAVIIELFEHTSGVIKGIIGNRLEMEQNVKKEIDFNIPLWDFFLASESRKVYRAVGYILIGSRLYGPYDNMFTVIKNNAQSTSEMTTNTISGQVVAGESISQQISVPAGTSDLFISLDYVGSDLDLHLYDSQGRHVGVSYQSGNIELQIPGASYS